MDSVTIDWAQGCTRFDRVNNSQKEYFDKKGFYVVLTGKYNKDSNKFENIRLQYIGLAYDQSIRERVQQEHSAYSKIQNYLNEHSEYTPLVMVGIIKNSTLGRITKDFFEDIEACLINDNKPLCNTQSIESYNGRDIKVTNTGDYSPLNQVSIINKK